MIQLLTSYFIVIYCGHVQLSSYPATSHIIMENYKVDLNNPLPRYYQVYVSLKDRILEGKFAYGDALPSERQLAIDYGVSRITIVKALDLLVDDDLIVRQHGRGNFVQDSTGAEITTEECKIAFCVPTPSETYIFSILLGATKFATTKRIQMQIVEIGEGEEETQEIRRLINQGFDGLILFSRSTQYNSTFYRELKEIAFPFVMMDRYSPEVPTDYVVFDDENTCYRLTESLIEAGHSQIAILLGSEMTVTAVKKRLNGYRKALKDHGLIYNPDWVGKNIYDVLNLDPNVLDNLKTTYTMFLENTHQHAPSAVISINATIAEMADSALSKIQLELLHVVINTDAKNIDYNINISQAAISHKQLRLNLTPLVALAIQSGENLGAKAVELLLDRIRQKLPDVPQKIVLPMQIQTFA